MFQSTPAITGGRCVSPPERVADQLCFNPRPPLLAGDAPWHEKDKRLRQFQSTPAITGGRCRPSRACGTTKRWFQSTPAITGGRCVGAGVQAVGHGVSIHARHYWRAMPSARVSTTALLMFQSTPAITGGRCHLPLALPFRVRVFQSTPAITGGRCLQRPERAANSRVSIHARHYWRAMQPMRPESPPQKCFNPRPPLLAGDAPHVQVLVNRHLFCANARSDSR